MKIDREKVGEFFSRPIVFVIAMVCLAILMTELILLLPAKAQAEEITFCVKRSGVMYQVGPELRRQECRTRDTLLVMNSEGPQGPKGDDGLPGEDGNDGLSGMDGVAGPQGPRGESGLLIPSEVEPEVIGDVFICKSTFDGMTAISLSWTLGNSYGDIPGILHPRSDVDDRIATGISWGEIKIPSRCNPYPLYEQKQNGTHAGITFVFSDLACGGQITMNVYGNWMGTDFEFHVFENWEENNICRVVSMY